ncbi:cation/hydrogen exchanger 15, CATION/H+ EXCHANGER 15 [Hibiscus trionum]|uniref:Cation/hydrogen exchanger 15, CATION/H+ EXCHANGER 15 n=1 Tax=Hibiscus trionum TaxID=183268 RepID=A0A9W7JIW5_HIBTR|nr:cation/hydrogen exchanger 15, CATION/H+ EXCHANGER 15 [Hibiscus trionum]
MDGYEDQCVILNISTNNGIYLGDNPFNEPLPMFVSQLAAILIVTRFLHHLFKPLHQPRIVSDVLGGLLLGPSALGTISCFADLFSTKNINTLETLAYLSLVLHMFLVGLELDLSAIGRTSKKAVIIIVTGLFLPFFVGIVFVYLLHGFFVQDAEQGYNNKCGFLWAAILAVTGFQAVNRILTELKLLNSEIGRLARPIALISDLGSWILIVTLIPFCANPMKAPFVITATMACIVVSFYTIRPLLAWIIRYTSDDTKTRSDFYLCFPLIGAVVFAFVTDVTGTHPIVGAFIFGLIMPDELTVTLMNRFDYFISGLMLPVFFAVSGLRVDIFKITKWSLVFVLVILLCAVKIISFVPVLVISNINTRDSFALGLLMCTKGTWAILVVATGLENRVLHDGDYAVTMVAILLMNSIVPPTIATIYKRSNLFAKYSSRTIQDTKPEDELQFLVCAHSYSDVPGMLKLLDVSHDSQRNNMTVFTLHLVELANQPSTMLIVHDSHGSRLQDSANTPRDYDSSEADRIVTAFTEFVNVTPNILIQSLTIVSPFRTVDRDICSLAKDKFVAFIILPFHKQSATSFRNINPKVLLNAPCSVGIFVYRGLESANIREIAMLFVGGADDCEALSYAWRMARKPGVSLTVIRLLEPDYFDYSTKQNEQDYDYIHEFRLQTADEELIGYEEKVLHCGEELVTALKEMENRFELFVVGKREGLESPITTELFHMVDCPELGVVGNLLAASDSAASSVLVVQQYIYSNTRRTLVFQKGLSRLERRKVNVESIPFL